MRRAAKVDAGSKYGNVKTGGHASKKEHKRAVELRLLQKAGMIKNLREQVKFVLIPKQPGERECSYIADFIFDAKVSLKNGDNPDVIVWQRNVCEDVKGIRTPVYRIKRKLMLSVHGIRIREV